MQKPPRCANCGSANTVHIVWGNPPLYGSRKADLTIGWALLGGRYRPPAGPDSACLACQPLWTNVHQLAVREEEYQQRMEDSLARSEIEEAKQYRDQRDMVRAEIREVLSKLVAVARGDNDASQHAHS